MADEELDFADLKEEELVDFEGSDYEFDPEEELQLEHELLSHLPRGSKPPPVHSRSPDPDAPKPCKTLPLPSRADPPSCKSSHDGFDAAESAGASPKTQGLGKEPDPECSRKWDAAESGEIQEDRDEKGGAVLQPRPSSSSSKKENAHLAVKVEEHRWRRHRKADLEDGELDDAAMPEGYDLEAKDIDDEKVPANGPERKRRKERFSAERQVEESEGNKAREPREINSMPSRHQHFRKSDHQLMDHLAGFMKAAGGRAINMHMMGFHQTSITPGIMGPGRPIMPVDLGSNIGLRPFGRGFAGPLGGFAAPGRPNINLQEALAQEHFLRSHRAMQLAYGNAPSAGRSPIAGPFRAAALRPSMGPDFVGPHGIMQLQPQGPDLIPQVNFAGPVDRFGRGQRPDFSAGRGLAGSCFPDTGCQASLSPRHDMGRQGPWSPPVSNEMQSAGRVGVHGWGNASGPGWSDQPARGHALPGHGVVMGQMNFGQTLHIGSTSNVAQGVGSGMPNMGPRKQRHGGVSHREGQMVHSAVDTRWKPENDKMPRNDMTLPSNIDTSNLSINTGQSDVKSKEDSRGRLNASRASNATSATPSTSGSNVIRLLQPVQKSRILSVSGLPENTSMSTVVEAFEKQGKIMDFRKGEKGGTFTISFSTESEAISAKRHLHRSSLAGRQITVEYAYL